MLAGHWARIIFCNQRDSIVSFVVADNYKYIMIDVSSFEWRSRVENTIAISFNRCAHFFRNKYNSKKMRKIWLEIFTTPSLRLCVFGFSARQWLSISQSHITVICILTFLLRVLSRLLGALSNLSLICWICKEGGPNENFAQICSSGLLIPRKECRSAHRAFSNRFWNLEIKDNIKPACFFFHQPYGMSLLLSDCSMDIYVVQWIWDSSHCASAQHISPELSIPGAIPRWCKDLLFYVQKRCGILSNLDFI